jgi:hypothetical protein
MLFYTTQAGTRHSAIELRDAVTFDASELDPERMPTADIVSVVRGTLREFQIDSSDVTITMPPNSNYPDIAIRCHPGTITLSWDPMTDGYEYPESGDDAADLND